LKGEVQAEAAKARETKAGVVPPPPAAPTEAIKSEGSAAEEQTPKEGEDEEKDKLADITNGHNRVAWDLRYADAKKFPGMILWAGGTTGPRVLPGTYTAKLTVGDLPAVTAPIEVKQEPRTTASAADLKAQFDFVKG